MDTTIQLGDIDVDIVLKDIKNVHLSVHPPSGKVRIAAPKRMNVDTIRLFAISKLGWIRKQQRKLRSQERETPRDFVTRESHYVWGKRYLLTLIETPGPPSIDLRHNRMILRVRPGTDARKRQRIVEDWYRSQVRSAAESLIAEWEPRIGVDVCRFFVQRMKTRWGSCNSAARSIRLNTDLAKKPLECLEYLVVHEMIHILEPTHNERFQALIGKFMPDWKHRREVLNRLPVRHEEWGY
jgi:predicted metal-dependent hydrolase